MMYILRMTRTAMANRNTQIRTSDRKFVALLLLWGMSAGLVWMRVLLTVGGTTDTLAAAEEGAWVCVCREFSAAMSPDEERPVGGGGGWSLCLGPVLMSLLLGTWAWELASQAAWELVSRLAGEFVSWASFFFCASTSVADWNKQFTS